MSIFAPGFFTGEDSRRIVARVNQSGNEMLPFIISYEVKAIKYHLGIIEEIRLQTLQRERAASSIAHSINGDEGEGGGENRAEPSEFIKKSNRGSSVRPTRALPVNLLSSLTTINQLNLLANMCHHTSKIIKSKF